jgi:hypothetical protein
MKGVLGSLGSSCQYKRLLFCLGCSGQHSTKYFFLTVHYFMVPIAQQPGQAVVLVRLSLNAFGRKFVEFERMKSVTQEFSAVTAPLKG